MIKVILVAGARPNFMKIAPVMREINRYPNELVGLLVHTGQHYDWNMSDAFFSSLDIRQPDYNLNVGSGSHAVQTAAVMTRFEKICIGERPDVVLVVGDVNSTIAAGLVAKKLCITLGHIEAGLRSGDCSMPEEINRLATDSITDIFFTTEHEGTLNLLKEGKLKQSIYFVGHVMIDNLYHQLSQISTDGDHLIDASIKLLKNRLPKHYFCLTMHRPSNVDDRDVLHDLLQAINKIAIDIPVIFPCHPRTMKNIKQFGLASLLGHCFDNQGLVNSGILVIDPLGYNDFLYLLKDAAGVLTDSGGLQEETTALKIPCITMRTTTERPATVQIGSNEVAGIDCEKIFSLANKILSGQWKESRIPDLWDGRTSERIVKVLMDRCFV